MRIKLKEFKGEHYLFWYDGLILSMAMCLIGTIIGLMFGFILGRI